MTGGSALVIVARFPYPGEVKTRLAKSLGFGLATELYRAFLRDVDAKFSHGFPAVYWAYTPENSPFPEFLGPDRNYLIQEGDDLGEKMFNAFRTLILQGYERIVLIGTDLPHLSPSVVEQAFERLGRYEVVLGPSEDGGYYLLGMRDLYDLFSYVSWSSPMVFMQTLMKAAEQGLSVDILPDNFDVDEPKDLQKLLTLVANPEARSSMPNTSTALSRLRQAEGTLGQSPVGRYFKLTPGQVQSEEQECLKVVNRIQDSPSDQLRAHLAQVAKVAGVLLERLREDLNIPLSDIAFVAAKYHDVCRSGDRSRRLRPYAIGPKGLIIPHDGHEARLAGALRRTGAKTITKIIRTHNVFRGLCPEERTIDENILLIADAMVEAGEIVPISVRREAIIARYATNPDQVRAFETSFDVVERTLELYFDAGLNWRRFYGDLSLPTR